MQGWRFKTALDDMKHFVEEFSSLVRTSGASHFGGRRRYFTIMRKETTGMTEYLASRLPHALKSKGLVQLNIPSLTDEAFREAAVYGPLIRRNPWSYHPGRQSVYFRGNHPRLFAWVREPFGLLHASHAGCLSCALFPYGSTKIKMKFSTVPGQSASPVHLHFDIFYSFNGDRDFVSTQNWGPTNDTTMTRLCAVQTTVPEDCFVSQRRGIRWLRRDREVHEVLVCLELLVIHPALAGPKVDVFAVDRLSRDVRCNADITWYSEPSHIVWKRDYAQAPG